MPTNWDNMRNTNINELGERALLIGGKMNKYLVLLSTKTSLHFMPDGAIYSFNINDSDISFYRIIDSRDKIISELDHGWIIEVKLNEENIDKAIDRATELSEFFLSAFCFETGCEIYRSNIVLIYEITEVVEKRVFRQYFHNLASSSAIQVTFPSLSEHVERIWSLETESRNRIYRAIRWFRKGIIGDDPLDQFLFFWHGLETLNSPLAKRFDCEKSIIKEIERQCKACGQKYTDIVTTKGGIEALFDDIGIEEPIRKKINKMRNGITHGFKDLSELYLIAIELLPTIAEILHCGIAKVLDISFEKPLFDNLKRVAPTKIGDCHYRECTLNEKDVSKLGIEGYYPFFTCEANTVPIEKGFEIRSKIQPHINCEYTAYALGVSGKNVKIKIKDIQ